MCGKRLNAWNTIPIRRRTAFTSCRRVISSPPRKMRPASIGSSRLTQRSRVDFPDPEAPISATTSCSATVRSMPRRTSWRPKDFDRFSTTSASLISVAPPDCRRRRSRRISQSVKRASGIVIATKRSAAHEIGGEVEGRVGVDLGLLERLDRTEGADERRVLLEADEVVQERRNDAPHRLRQDHATERLPAREPEGAGRRLLARVDRLDARAVDLGDVGAVDQDERDDPPEDDRRGDVAQTRAPARRSRASRSRGSSECPGRGRHRRSRARAAGRRPAPAGCGAPRGRARRRG